MDAEAYYKDATPPAEKQNRAPPLDRSRQNFDDLVRSTSTRRRDGDPSSLGKTKAITKEEKRARVEAAEQRARERAAAAAAAAPHISADDRQGGQHVHFRSRRASAGQEDKGGVAAADLDETPRKSPLSQHPLEEGRGHSSAQSSQLPVPKSRNISDVKDAVLPKRNLSFRERAVKNDLKMPQDEDSGSSKTSPATTPGGGISLARNGSNKLKKNPPGDPWYSKRVEVEEKYPAAGRDEPAYPSRVPSYKGPARNATVKNAHNRPQDDFDRPPARGKTYNEYDEIDASPSRSRGDPTAATGVGRSVSLGSYGRPPQPSNGNQPTRPPGKTVAFSGGVHPDDEDSDLSSRHGFRGFVHRDKLPPGQGMYKAPKYLDEWRKATVGTLSGGLLDITAEVPKPPEGADQSATYRRSSGNSMSSRPQRAEAFDGEYDDTQLTRFKPPLYLKCGPLLRYCGIRHEKAPPRSSRSGTLPEREIWRGTVMIVTQDAESSYEITPILRLFVQPIELLPPPPAELRGELLPEYVDPIAGIPKLGRKGETLYVRPIEHLEESKDLSMLGPDEGLFERTRTAPDFDNAPDAPGSFTGRRKRIEVDGERLGKYKDVRGFRLHAERGCTFWRFNIEVELGEKQQRIAYRINRGPSTGFWVPARGQSMNIMFHSCNGFSLSVKPDDVSGPDPMWRDVLNTHQTQPFHVMVGGGDQIYNDAVMRQTKHFQDWLKIQNPLHKHNAPFTAEMQDELEDFYLERYAMWFSQGLFGLANSQIPMVNMYDDHDIIDGFGSYPNHFMKSPVFSGLGAVAFKYYMLFQHQSVMEETEQTEPSWTLGCRPGPYIQELSRSVYVSMGGGVTLLAVDARTERTRDEVIREDTWKKLIDRCYAEIAKGQTKHLLVLLGVPIAYPRLVWLENILTSRLMDPIKALGKTGLLGNFLNNFDGGVEVLDDLDDHWTAKNHKDERKFVIEDLQDLAADKSVRITMLSGDVHLAAIGQFYSNPKLKIAKHKDFRYMPNIISSAIVNTPPPDLLADVLNKRNKVHHLDKETDEDMIPIFTTGIDGKARNNKRLLPHRNWCSIREYVPGSTPPPTPPPPEETEYTPDPTPPGSRAGGLFRRFSLSRDGRPAYRPDVPDEKDRSRPPVSSGSFFRRRSTSSGPQKRSGSVPGRLMRTLSLGHRDSEKSKSNGGFFSRRRTSMDQQRRPDDGGINGTWGTDDSEENIYDAPPPQGRRTRPTAFEPAGANDKLARMGLRGGAGPDRAEFEAGDDSYFSARPARRTYTQPVAGRHHDDYDNPAAMMDAPAPKPFKRTPTGLSVKKLRKHGPARYEVDLEGGLDVTLNVEINPKDPSGASVPYRLLVPRLVYEYQGEDGDDFSQTESGESDEKERAGPAGPPGPPLGPTAGPYREGITGYEGTGAYAAGEKMSGGIMRMFSGRGRRGGKSGGPLHHQPEGPQGY